MEVSLRKLAIRQTVCKCTTPCAAGNPPAAVDLARFWDQLEWDIALHGSRFESLRSMVALQSALHNTCLPKPSRYDLSTSTEFSWDALNGDAWTYILQLAGARATCCVAAASAAFRAIAHCEDIWLDHFAALHLEELPSSLRVPRILAVCHDKPSPGWRIAHHAISDLILLQRWHRQVSGMVSDLDGVGPQLEHCGNSVRRRLSNLSTEDYREAHRGNHVPWELV